MPHRGFAEPGERAIVEAARRTDERRARRIEQRDGP
jgi:hypothetical protein